MAAKRSRTPLLWPHLFKLHDSHSSSGVVEGIGMLAASSLACGFREVEQCLAREFRDIRVRMPKKGNERAKPAKLFRLDADNGNRFCHWNQPRISHRLPNRTLGSGVPSNRKTFATLPDLSR